jgi:flagellar biosynthesis/type III secretory pathway protein FliH
MQLISGFIDTYLRLSREEELLLRAEIASMEPVEQEVVMQIVTSWMEEGIEQGKQLGKEEGKQEAMLSLIMRQLPKRIGAVNPLLQERIGQLSLTQLEDLAEALLDFSSVADLEAHLQGLSEEG